MDPDPKITKTNINHDAFWRLRWSIFKDLSAIQVMDDPEDPKSPLSTFLGHPIAAKSATEIPIHGMFVSVLATMRQERPMGETDPEPLEIRRADGGTLTVGDVVEQLSAYCKHHHDEICEGKSPFLHLSHGTTEDGWSWTGISDQHNLDDYPDDLEVIFHELDTDEIDIEEPYVNVELWADGEDGVSSEYYWNNRNDIIPI